MDAASLMLERFPPFQAMDIRVLELDDAWQRVRILLPLNPQNRNPGGTMFGGAIASLADPIAALACARHFPDHVVWTKSLTVDFLRPGTADMELIFEFPVQAMDTIRVEMAEKGRCDYPFQYGVYLGDGSLCCRVSCVVAFRPPELGSSRRGFRNKL